MKNRVEILGVTFDNVTLAEAAETAYGRVMAGEKTAVVTPNGEFVLAAREDPAKMQLLNEAQLVVPDGIAVLKASRILGRPLKARVPGIDLADTLAGKLAGTGKKLFLLGAKPGVAEKAAETLQKKYPGLTVCGTHDGYFKEDGPVVELLRESGADAVYVCLGFPRQEQFMHDYLPQLPATLMIGLGGSFDVWAGMIPRAPKLFRKLGLEWLYRLIREPWRFSRMIKIPKVLWLAWKEKRK